MTTNYILRSLNDEEMDTLLKASEKPYPLLLEAQEEATLHH
ncbi:hypothetical protein AZE42_13861 [Rhizopogon vesiculosus]|uniref:Uncharacterized protein n=1 Tax=Rhizopogon vesiculosus TaxID=180088 RepID=A0A1J8Q7A9_9AGAM|nr:hypothetical protein AZE42_13861 [Rhizopogon vesiculosus]